MKRKRIAYLTAVILALLLLSACGKTDGGTEPLSFRLPPYRMTVRLTDDLGRTLDAGVGNEDGTLLVRTEETLYRVTREAVSVLLPDGTELGLTQPADGPLPALYTVLTPDPTRITAAEGNRMTVVTDAGELEITFLPGTGIPERFVLSGENARTEVTVTDYERPKEES